MIFIILLFTFLGYMLNGLCWLGIETIMIENIKSDVKYSKYEKNKINMSEKDKNIASWLITFSLAIPFLGILSILILWLISVFLSIKNKL